MQPEAEIEQAKHHDELHAMQKEIEALLLAYPYEGGGQPQEAPTHPQPIESSSEYQRTTNSTPCSTWYCPASLVIT